MSNNKTSSKKYLSDILPYYSLDSKENVFFLKDGSTTKTIEVLPKNTFFYTENDYLALRQALDTVLCELPENSLIQIYFIREKSRKQSDEVLKNWEESHENINLVDEVFYPEKSLYDSKTEYINNQLNKNLLFNTKIYLTLGLKDSDSSIGKRLGPLSFFAHKRKSKNQNQLSNLDEKIEHIFQKISISLGSLDFEVREVSNSEKMEFTYKFLNPDRPKSFSLENFIQNHELSKVLANTDLIETNQGLKLGRVPLYIGTLKELPDGSFPCNFTSFATLMEEFYVVQTILVLPQTAEKERLLRKQRIAQAMAGGNAVRNLLAESQLSDIEDTITAMISSGSKLYCSSWQMIYFGDQENTDLENKNSFHTLLDEGERLGAGCQWFEETVGAYQCFFGLLPFAPCFITRPKRILTNHLSDLLPFFGIGPGHEHAELLFETPYQSLLGFSLFEKSPSANAILIGSTGSGKSTLANGIILGMNTGLHNDRPSTFVIDVGNSFKRSIEYLNGTSIDLVPDGRICINPFDLEKDQNTPNPEKIKFLTAFFEEVLGEEGTLGKLEKSLLEEEIILFYKKDVSKTLSNFKEHLSYSLENELKKLAKLLSLWCKPHPYGLLFDGETTIAQNSKHFHFELKECQRYPDLLRVAMIVVMDAIWREVKTRFPKRSLIVIDECHTLLRSTSDGRSNTTARWVEDCFRQMRKFSSAAIAISQTAKDLKSDEVGDGILANAPNRFILKQRGDEVTLKENLKLNEKEIDQVFSLSQVRGSYSEFYLQSETIKGVYRYRPTPLELWLSTTHPPDLALLKQEKELHPTFHFSELMQHMAESFPNGA